MGIKLDDFTSVADIKKIREIEKKYGVYFKEEVKDYEEVIGIAAVKDVKFFRRSVMVYADVHDNTTKEEFEGIIEYIAKELSDMEITDFGAIKSSYKRK
jgi:hypothetical protein